MNDKAWSTRRLISASANPVGEARRRCCPARSPGKARVLLEYDADPFRYPASQYCTDEGDAPAGRIQQARQHVEERRFSATGRPHDRKEFAAIDLEIQRAECMDVRASSFSRKHLSDTRASIWPPASRMTDFPLEEVEQPLIAAGKKQENQQRQREYVDNVVNFHPRTRANPTPDEEANNSASSVPSNVTATDTNTCEDFRKRGRGQNRVVIVAARDSAICARYADRPARHFSRPPSSQ